MGNILYEPRIRRDSKNEKLITESRKSQDKFRKSMRLLKHEPNFHTPQPIKSDEIFEMYSKIIEEDNAFNQRMYTR